MNFKKLVSGATLALMLGAGAAVAENLVLIVGNTGYRNFPGVKYGAIVTNTVSAFREADYTVINLQNATEANMKSALDRFENSFEDADRVVVVLSGHFLNAGTATWFAPIDLRSPSLANAGYDALPMSAILAYLGEKPGASALFLAPSETREKIGSTIEKGIGELHIPQGVAVVRGAPKNIAWALQNRFLEPGVSIATAAEGAPLVSVEGFVSNDFVLAGNSVDIRNVDVSLEPTGMEEEAYWRVVEDIGSKATYMSYLRRYPNGEFAGQAKRRIQVIEDTAPKYTPEEQAEINLNLKRNDRRRVQEQLSLIGFDPRGIDGVFGPGSRTAISRWQAENGMKTTGFLNGPALRKLRAQAEQRAAQLKQEARRKQQERDQADIQFWTQTGAHGKEADYSAYLSKYPDGLYADAARDGLARIENNNRLKAKAAERQAWDQARQVDTVPAYRNFLKQYPKGAFSKTAQARINARSLTNKERAIFAQAKKEEQSLKMGPSMKVLLERKLNNLGLQPGKQDGVIDKQTRKALRRYQKSRGLHPTGFVSRNTIIRLMSE